MTITRPDPRLTSGGNGPAVDVEDITELSFCLEQTEERNCRMKKDKAGCLGVTLHRSAGRATEDSNRSADFVAFPESMVHRRRRKTSWYSCFFYESQTLQAQVKRPASFSRHASATGFDHEDITPYITFFCMRKDRRQKGRNDKGSGDA